MANTVTHEMVQKFAQQMVALLRAEGGLGAFVTILLRGIAKSEVPTPEVLDDMGKVSVPAKDIEIDDKAFNTIFSEELTDKSLWWLMNALIAKSAVQQGVRLKHATGDEFRLAKTFVESTSAGTAKDELLARIGKLEKDEKIVEFPDIGV